LEARAGWFVTVSIDGDNRAATEEGPMEMIIAFVLAFGTMASWLVLPAGEATKSAVEAHGATAHTAA
jgi:hypothetical protein